MIKFLTSCIDPAAVQILSLSYVLRAVGMGHGRVAKGPNGTIRILGHGIINMLKNVPRENRGEP